MTYRAELDADKQVQIRQWKELREPSVVRRRAIIRAHKQRRQKPCMKKGKTL